MPIIKWLDNETQALFDSYLARKTECEYAAQSLNISTTNKTEICPIMWDGAVCWPPLDQLNTIASIGQKFTQDCSYESLGMHLDGMQTAQCTNYSTWSIIDMNCSIPTDITDRTAILISAITHIGYSLSLVFLIPAVFIFCFVPQLHCTRNFIHTNLMLSFILRGLFFTLQHNTELNLMDASSNNEIKYLYAISSPITGGDAHSHHDPQYTDLSTQIAYCKFLKIFFLFSILATSFWLLNEGIYLYNILVFSVFKSNERMLIYNIIGWLIPSIISTICYVRLHNSGQSFCWNNDGDTRIWTEIIEVPTWLCSVINFLIFLRMISIMTKMIDQRSHGSVTSDTVRLLKSILMLFALLGLNDVFALVVSLKRGESNLKIIADTVIGSYEGLVIALLYCFLNAEVQAEIGRKFRNWYWQDHLVRRRSTRSSLSLPSALGKITSEVSTDKELTTRVSVENDSGIESNRESLELSRNHRPSFI